MIIFKHFYNLHNPLLTVLTISLLLIQSSCAQTELTLDPLADNCQLGNAVESTDGIRRMALIVGVGQYIKSNIPDLPGPPEDAKRFYKLLTGSQGYSFPKENVCLLLDAQATTENFRNKFTNALINRARANDEVVIYYAGHGSQTEDKNGDEQDGMDETFVFHDARTKGIKDLLDDEFNSLLTKLHKKTQQITVFLDSCNSGTAMRGDVGLLSRYVPPAMERLTDTTTTTPTLAVNKETGWISSSLPGIVIFTAAGDGTSAFERNASGIFTNAVISVLGQINAKPLTYAQAARQIRPLVRAESYQIPYFQGDLQRGVFSGFKRNHPLSWEIIEVDPHLKLGGFPLPGIGKGAEFRVYDGSINGADTQDPAKVKAVIILDETTGFNATGHITQRTTNTDPILPGDIAVLSRPSNEQRLLKVTVRPESTPGGITAERSGKLAVAIDKHIDAKTMLSIVQDNGDFELSYDRDTYIITGPENLVRNQITKESDVIENLRQHAIQRVLSPLRGEGGKLFIDQETLQLQVIPAKNQDQCAQDVKWQQSLPNAIKAQEIPLCYKWHVKVKLSANSPVPLLIGGLVLSTDGSIFGFPADGTAVPLKPGETLVFNETFVGAPPLNIEDQIIVFGTQETNPVPWSKLTQSSVSRSADVKNGLYRLLDNYITGTRGAGLAESIETEDTGTAWTLSSITMRVIDKK